jgi:hypothetical protein
MVGNRVELENMLRIHWELDENNTTPSLKRPKNNLAPPGACFPTSLIARNCLT